MLCISILELSPTCLDTGAIQVLCNIVGGGGWEGVRFPGKSVTKMYGSTLSALRGGGWVSNFQKTSVT